MAYTPNAPAIFIAAYAGALAGMGISNPVTSNTLQLGARTNPAPPNYTALAAAAGAWAIAFDTVWGDVRPVSDLDIDSTENASESLWHNRATPPPDSANPNSYIVEVNAVIAAITAAENYFITNGIPQNAGGGGSGNVNASVTAFSYTTTSPLSLGAVASGESVNRAAILITIPFDDVSATLQLGTPFSPALLLAAGDNKPGQIGQYENDSIVRFISPDSLQLTITPGASTMGAGLVFLQTNT